MVRYLPALRVLGLEQAEESEADSFRRIGYPNAEPKVARNEPACGNSMADVCTCRSA